MNYKKKYLKYKLKYISEKKSGSISAFQHMHTIPKYKPKKIEERKENSEERKENSEESSKPILHHIRDYFFTEPDFFSEIYLSLYLRYFFL